MSFNYTRVNYTCSAKYALVAQWSASATVAVGAIVRQLATPSANNERAFIAIVGGTAGGTEPTWSLSRGAKTTDNTVTWQEITGQPAFNGDIASTSTWTDAKNSSVSLGHVIKDASSNIFICTTAGTAGNGSEPSWNTSAAGNTTTDNSVTWTFVGNITAFSAWGAPHARLNNALAGGWGDTLQNTFFVGKTHSETQASWWFMTFRGSLQLSNTSPGPISVLCVDEAGSLPPVSADLSTGALIATTGSNGMTLAGCLKMLYGTTFRAGTSGSPNLELDNDAYGSSAEKFIKNCRFEFGSGVGGSEFKLDLRTNCPRKRIVDCVFKFSGTNQAMGVSGAGTILENTSVDAAGSIPTTLLNSPNDLSRVIWKDSDLSALSGTKLFNTLATNAEFTLSDCKMASTFTPQDVFTTPNGEANLVTLSRCYNSAANYRFLRYSRLGQIISVTDAVRHSGATDGSQQYALKCSTSQVGLNWVNYLELPAFAYRNNQLGTNVDITVHGAIVAAALPTNADVYGMVEYLGSSSDTLATIKTNRVADVLATPSSLTADTASDWTDGATARANSHAYAVGDVMKVASNSGRLFYCTTAGTSAASEPGGYASAVDGGTVTDGGATFRAVMRFKFTLTLTSPQPAVAGNLYVTVFIGAASATVFIDPTVDANPGSSIP